MIDATQLLLTFVIVILTVMMTVIFIQVYFILREFRNTLAKANKVLDDTGVISESVSKPINMISAMLLGIKGGSGLWRLLGREKREEEK